MTDQTGAPAYAAPPEPVEDPALAGMTEDGGRVWTVDDRVTEPSLFLPPNLTTSVGLLSANVLFLVASIEAIVFIPWLVPSLLGEMHEFAPVLGLALAGTALLPVAIGASAVVGLVRAGFLGPGTARIGPHRARPERAINAVRLATALSYLQGLCFLTLFGGICLELLITGRPADLPLEVSSTLTVWMVVEITLVLAIHQDSRRRPAALLVVAVVAAVHLVALSAPLRQILLALVDASIVALLVYTSMRFVLDLGRLSTALHGDQARRREESTTLESAVTEAGRIEDLIHDHILSCLLLTARGGAEDEWASGQIRSHAATALRTLDEIADPTPAPALTPLNADQFLRRLQHQIELLAPSVVVHARGRRRRRIPAEVDHALTEATLEAVRNSLRHADGSLRHGDRSVYRRVDVDVSEEIIAIEVSDDGAGFDLVHVPPRSTGLRGAILRRVQQLPGGHAGVASAPQQGTTVHMSWTDPSAQDPVEVDRGPSRRRRVAAWLGGRTGTDLPLETQALSLHLRDPRLTLRIGLTLLLVTGTMVLSLPEYEPAWTSGVALALLWTSAFMLSRTWKSGSGDGSPPAWTWPVLGLVPPAMATLTLYGWNGQGPRDVEVWSITAMMTLLVLLALAHYDLSAWMGALGASAVFVAWSVTTGQDDAPWSGGWYTFLVVVFLCTIMGRWAYAQFDTVARMQRDREKFISESLAQAQVLRQRRARSRELEQVVRPLMTKLASPEPVTAEMELEAGLLEARLRDDMRAKAFHGTAVARSAWEARARGVLVEIMDDGGLEHASAPLKQAVVSVVARRIDQAHDGQVTVRVLPADRDVVVTVLHRPTTGFHVRTEIFEDGHARTVTT